MIVMQIQVRLFLRLSKEFDIPPYVQPSNLFFDNPCYSKRHAYIANNAEISVFYFLLDSNDKYLLRKQLKKKFAQKGWIVRLGDLLLRLHNTQSLY